MRTTTAAWLLLVCLLAVAVGATMIWPPLGPIVVGVGGALLVWLTIDDAPQQGQRR